MRFRVVRDAFVPFAVLVAVAAALIPWYPWAAAPMLVLAGFILWFFRDPERTPPADPHAIVAPADGRVIRADEDGVSVFLNLFDVHVCRSPLAARVASLAHERGRFLAAFREEASEQNERVRIELEGESTHVQLTLVAGLVARRIVSWVAEGQHLGTGERLGMIRFGSRVDVRLPAGVDTAVRVGKRVRAGETVIARIR